MVSALFLSADVFHRRPGRAEPVGRRPRPYLRRIGLPLALCLVPVTALASVIDTDSSSRLGTPNADARASDVSLAIFPVSGACWYTDTWQASRPGGRVHEGVDIGAAGGTPLVAVANGKIAKMYTERPDWRGGNALRLTMADGTYFFYGHLQGFAEGIAVGTPVAAGQVIGYVGKTGNAGVDHLHFEVHPGGGSPVNPYPLVKAVNTCSSSGRGAPAPASTTPPGGGGAPATTSANPIKNFTPAPVGTSGCVSTHLVAAGEYWYLIAARYGVAVRKLTAANGRTIESFIYPDETLCLPGADWVPPAVAPPAAPVPTPTPTTPPVAPTSNDSTTTTVAVERPKAIPLSQCQELYTIRRGDYWVMLGDWYGKRASRIAAANGKLLTDAVHPGDVVCIPY
jgi:LysM repeat protein